MQPRQVDSVMHLIDQFCPDKVNEIDRDAFGAALEANPFTCIVKLNDLEEEEEEDDTVNNHPNKRKEEAKEEEEEEVYGLASAFDLNYELRSHPKAFKPLCDILKNTIWRVILPGIPPTDLLLSTIASTPDESECMAQYRLFIMEYVRNVPLELTVEIMEDLIRRVEEENNNINNSNTNHTQPLKKAHTIPPPCGFALLAKIQRAKQASAGKPPNADKSRKMKEKARDSQAASAVEDNTFDLSQFIFWREEEEVLFRHRDQRIATWAYRCRPQYIEQPTQEIPISLLFIIKPESMKKAVEEIKKHASTLADIVHF
ncbi:unnamed protein product [Phytomonas sp. Hart1]|nr:unnamed protein product [Phytomonas sp. Hart1]|eukprot:CCW68640.1 unnamed protein product [Phytomonas sp. isolate Hart1]